MKYLIAVFLIILSACEKYDESPELKDPIFQDLLKLADEERKSIDVLKKVLAEAEKNLKAAYEQKGQVRLSKKKVEDSVAAVTTAQQRTLGLELRAERRKGYCREKYKLAFSAGKPWPDPAEYEEYQRFKKSRQISRLWKVDTRLKELGLDQKRKVAGKK